MRRKSVRRRIFKVCRRCWQTAGRESLVSCPPLWALLRLDSAGSLSECSSRGNEGGETPPGRAEKANDQILKELQAVVLRSGFRSTPFAARATCMQSRPNYRDVGLTLAVESRPFIIHSYRSFLLSADKDGLHLPAGEASHRCQSSGASPPGAGGRHAGRRNSEQQPNMLRFPPICRRGTRVDVRRVSGPSCISVYGELRRASSSVTEVQFQRN